MVLPANHSRSRTMYYCKTIPQESCVGAGDDSQTANGCHNAAHFSLATSNLLRFFAFQAYPIKILFRNTYFLDLQMKIALPRRLRGCRLVWSRLVASGAIDPGSNPGSPI